MKNTKDHILDVSLSLFLEKGFDETSISDILKELAIARGTLYYHFESKESIMDAIIERFAQDAISAAEQIVQNKNLSALEKFYGLFANLQMEQMSGGQQMLDYLHKPQNALFHEKSNQMILTRIAPFLAKIIDQGNQEGQFNNAFPQETAEMILLLAAGFINEQAGDKEKRLGSLFYALERLLGAQEGTFSGARDLTRD